MADNSFDYTTGQWGAGDGYTLDPNYGGYQVPLFNSGAYNNDQSSLLAPANSVGYTSAADQLGLVPNYSDPNYAASAYESGGAGALGALGSGLGSIAGGAGSTLGAIGGGIGTLVGAYEGASTNTGSSVLSGAASGAAAGTMIMPGIGTAIGAVLGGIAGLFGSKSKKKQEKQAFQQAEQQAVLPYQQQQANYLQNQGLLQKAISNYRSAFTPGGYHYTNALTGGPRNNSFGIPTQAPSLPNFNQAPPNVVPGSGNSSLGIAGYSLPNNGVSLTPGAITQPSASSNPYYGFTAPTPLSVPTAPSYSGNKTTDQNNISNYQKQYQQYLQDQQQQMAAQSMNAYQPYFQGV